MRFSFTESKKSRTNNEDIRNDDRTTTERRGVLKRGIVSEAEEHKARTRDYVAFFTEGDMAHKVVSGSPEVVQPSPGNPHSEQSYRFPATLKKNPTQAETF